MLGLKKKFAAYLISASLVVFSVFPVTTFASPTEERPTASHMVGDAITRPFVLVGAAIGTVLFVATLPISVLGGNVKEAGQELVVTPFKMTFFRCLGCTTRNIGK
ncbi:MAG: hypothetical protein KUG76_00825 [Gammaproteobacteria bacterium]|nr:hypothetical protein [Gammaproteobacteria bacterium]